MHAEDELSRLKVEDSFGSHRRDPMNHTPGLWTNHKNDGRLLGTLHTTHRTPARINTGQILTKLQGKGFY
jgi:hypothetical protein